MNQYVIIVAGGTGTRMKSDIPKQFIAVNGLPILMHTLHAFNRYSSEISIILVLPEDQFPFWKELCLRYQFQLNYQLIAGGKTRFESVKNGLRSIKSEKGIVAVHDGVRPLISKTVISNCITTAAEKGTAVAAVALKDSIRTVYTSGKSLALDRSLVRLIQTPQAFRLDWMKEAFDQPYQTIFTDYASVLESAGYPINLVEGSYENIKITTPEDLKWAEVYLR